MSRVKRGTTRHKKRERLLKHAKGFSWSRKNKYRAAKEALMKAWTYAYRDRRNKKRDFRRLWNIQINAASRKNGLTYSKFQYGLKQKNIEIDRKILSTLAKENPDIFAEITKKVKE